MTAKAYLDANILISLVEAESSQIPQVRRFLGLVELGLATAVTSEMSLAEVLVKPLKYGDLRLLKAYEALFASGSLINLLPYERGMWLEVASYRALNGLKLADAMHVAVAVKSGCDLLITADTGIKSIELMKVLRPESHEFAKWLDNLS